MMKPSLPAPPPAFVCPRCGRESWSIEDRRHGYCGACHDYTGVPAGTDASAEHARKLRAAGFRFEPSTGLPLPEVDE